MPSSVKSRKFKIDFLPSTPRSEFEKNISRSLNKMYFFFMHSNSYVSFVAIFLAIKQAFLMKFGLFYHDFVC